MCDVCGMVLCAIYDQLVRTYWDEVPAVSDEERHRRSAYMLMEPTNAPVSAGAEPAGLGQLADHVSDIGMTRMEFLRELTTRCGFETAIQRWIQGKVPNGWVRKVILQCAENILRERGANPVLSLKMAA